MRNHFISFALSFISESISAVPDPVRLELGAESAKWFRDLLISGSIVAFGCLLEIWETAVSLRNWFRARRGFEVKENPRSWGIPIAAVGLLLVVGGVVGEVVYEGLSSNADVKLQSHESAVLSVAETNAADAEGKAGELEKGAAQLGKETAEAKLETARVEAQMQPRRLSLAREKDIADALKPYAGKTVGVATYTQDAEAMLLAVQIANALGKAKISVHNRIGTFGAIGFPLMLSVIVDKNSADKKLESALFRALKIRGGLATFNDFAAFGQGSTMLLPAGTTHEDAFIFVGEKALTEETLPTQPMKISSQPSINP